MYSYIKGELSEIVAENHIVVEMAESAIIFIFRDRYYLCCRELAKK